MVEQKKALVNVIRIVGSNILTLLVSILSSFLIPKILSIDSYGYYKTFALYITYCGLLHFGITNGVYLFLAGKNIDDLNRKKIHSIIFSIVFIEGIISTIIILATVFSPLAVNYKIVLTLVAIYNFILQFESIQRNILEATKCFKYEARVVVIKNAFTALMLLSFWAAYKAIPSFEPAFYYCALFTILAILLSSIIYAIKLRKFIFSKGQPIKETKKDLTLFIKIGLPMMICNLTGTLINSIDRQFVSVYFPIEASTAFSEYSFAYSMLSFVTMASAAITTVVYPYMKGKTSERIINFYPKFHGIIAIFISISFVSFFLFFGLIPAILPKYIESLPIFRVLLPNLALDICVTVIMHNYYKFYNLENKFLVVNIMVLALTILLDFAAYYFIIANSNNPDPIWFSVASVICGIVWYLTSQLLLAKKIKIKHWKNDAFLLLTIIVFYATSFFIDSWVKGMLVYIAFIVLFALSFYQKELIYFLRKFIRKNA